MASLAQAEDSAAGTAPALAPRKGTGYTRRGRSGPPPGHRREDGR